MKEATIFLQHNRKWPKWYENVITWLITKMTVKGPYIHTQIYLRGWVYEYTIGGKSIARKTKYPGAATMSKEHGDLVREPVFDLTEKQIDLMVEWWEKQVGNKYKYATVKLLIQLALGWMRPLFVWLYQHWGIEVMKDNSKWGEHCSGAVDESFKAAGIDIFPGQSEQYTTPSAFAYSDKFRSI
jgi:hypothetical protein